MLTGFFTPSKGTAIVDGHDIRFGLGQARERMGLCPQHNMLFDNISVMNHLIIFGMGSQSLGVYINVKHYHKNVCNLLVVFLVKGIDNLAGKK